MERSNIDVETMSNKIVSTLLEFGLSRQSTVIDEDIVEILQSALHDSSRRCLNSLLDDLNSPVTVPSKGPMSFCRLMRIGESDVRQYDDMSFLQILQSSQAKREILECLADYGEFLSASVFPDETRLTGAVIHVLAVMALNSRFQVAVEMSDPASTSALMESIGTAQELPQEIRNCATQSTHKF